MDNRTRDSSPIRSLVGGVDEIVAGRYEIRAVLGRGAAKEVYLAYDARLDREVALALVVGAALSDVARARVAREAKVTGRLGDHPNVITVYDSGEHEGLPYLVLRAMPGGSLAEALERGRPSVDDVLRIAEQIATALAHAHAHGVVHRDVKPDNVWLAGDGAAALGDFGIAHEAGADRLTAEGIVVGTVRYLSPEQIRGEDVGPASDLYALGVTLYELLAGRAPFEGPDPESVLVQHLSKIPPPPSQHEPDIPPALERLVLELLAKQPARRPASAAEVALALRRLRARGGGTDVGASGWSRPRDTAATAAAAAQPPAGSSSVDARRLVAVLAARSEAADPENLHAVLDRCAAVIARHGGDVERYLGDTVVGLFGLTDAHGDEPLRAARAAVELRATQSGLRLGIESGEVFLAGGPRGTTAATGAPITAAGRLSERAARGEILLGDDVRRTLGADARVDPARGSLVDVVAEQPQLLRVADTPFVARARELDELRAAFADVRERRRCRLITLVGPAGIGKSRLAGEFVATLGDAATLLAGRCAAYGEGTAYRPLADIVRGLGDEPRRRLEALLAGDAQALHGILGAIGLSGEPAHAEETAWAFRLLLERLARERPVVVAIEDLHWADPALLDLLDHVVALSDSAPILVIGLTRPELVEARPAWAGAQPNRSLVSVGALPQGEAHRLAQRLGAGPLAARIAARAEGNPLFVEQLVAVAGEDELPASIQAVLAARIDSLDPGERSLLQRGSVQGRTFHAGALASLLAPEERPLARARLAALVNKGLVDADRSEFAGEDAYRFAHALIREAAYARLPKLLRAELHTRVAEWLERRPEAAEEVIAFHFEQSCRLAGDLQRASEREHALAVRAIRHFDAAAQSALGRGDPAAASGLLERAGTLVGDDDPVRAALLPALGAALFDAGRVDAATAVLDEAIARATEPRAAARARLERAFVRLEVEAAAATADARAVVDGVLETFAGAGDEGGRSRALCLRAQAAWLEGRVEDADAAWLGAARSAERAGAERALFEIAGWRATAAVLGPAPVEDAIRRLEELRARVGVSPVALAWTINPLATLHAMRGDLARADEYLADAGERLRQLGGLGSSVNHHAALVHLLAGRPERAEAGLRAGVEQLASLGDSRLLATTTAMLAQAVAAQGRASEADELCAQTAAAAARDDIITQALWRGVRAQILAAAGDREAAVALAHDAVALMRPTDLLSHHGDALLRLADVQRACGRDAQAASSARDALALYERKGNATMAARTRAFLAGAQV